MAISSTQKAQLILGALQGSGINLTLKQVANLTKTIETLYAKGGTDAFVAAKVVQKPFIKAQLNKLIKLNPAFKTAVDLDGNGKVSLAEKKALYVDLAGDLVTKILESQFTLTQDKTQITEGLAPANFTVNGKPGATLTWSVDSAHTGDVLTASGTVTLNALGVGTFSITAKQDALVEGSEPITVTLKDSNGEVKATNQLTINDPENPALIPAEIFTLKEVLVPATEGTPAQTEIYWGYNPHPHSEGSGVDNEAGGNTNNQTNEGPEDGGIPVAELIKFLTTITGLDLKELGLIDADGQDPFQNVTNLTLSNPISSSTNPSNSGNADDGSDINQGSILTIEYADGTFLNAEVALGDAYFDFLNNLLFDNEGNSRLFEKEIPGTGTSGTEEHLIPILLTPLHNNGGTIETNVVTSPNDDLIVAGRLELLHQAYIDGGAGYNKLEIDAKGTYAQPAALLKIQEVRVNDLPNFYTSDYHDGDGYLENTWFNDSNNLLFPDPDGTGSDNSWLDLNRAIDLQKLVVTDGGWGEFAGEGEDALSEDDGYSGNLTIVGVRNAATLRLEGSFVSGSTTIQYGFGQTGTLNVELLLGDVTQDINILQNASVLSIDSQGIENHMHNFFAGGSVSRMIVKGTGAFGVDEDLNASFNQGRPAIIDASANTGGLDVTLNNHYKVTIKGTSADDEIITNYYDASGSGSQDPTGDSDLLSGDSASYQNPVNRLGDVIIEAGNGNNTIQADYRNIVSITSGTGNDNIQALSGEDVTIVAGDGKNVINTDGSDTVDITTGTGNDSISARNGLNVSINAGNGNNNIDADYNFDGEGGAFGQGVISITTGTGNDTITAVRHDSVTIDAGNGTNNITVSANDITVTTGSGNDTLTISGMDTLFDQGDAGVDGESDAGGNNDWNDDNAGVNPHFADEDAPGALLTINLGSGINTINLGRDVTDLDGSSDVDVEYGVTALEGSVITGSNIRLFVENHSDLTQADLTGATITSVVLKQELRITAEQFDAIGAPAFSVKFDEEGATEDLYIVVNSDTSLDDLLDGQTLASSVRLHFEIRNGATLTLSAEQLHKMVAWHGIDSTDGLNGKVVITNAGPTFDPFDNGDDYQVIDGGSLTGNFSSSEDVTILRSPTGYNRPEPTDSTDTTIIDSTGTETLVITDPVVIAAGNATTLKLIGNQDIVFETYVDLGDRPDEQTGGYGDKIDFSELDGTVTGLTVKNFDNITSVAGNNTDTRINVELTGNVGSEEQGLVSSGVETYVVTSIVDNDDNDGDSDTDTATFYLCDDTKDVEVIGLQGNEGKTLTFANVPWGLVHPSILLEGDGYADWNGGLKADGNPETSDIGTVVVEYFTAGAPAIVNINNGGVELGVNSTGGERYFDVDGIELINAASLTLNVTEGDAVIQGLTADSGLKSLTVTATEDVTIEGELPTSLTAIDASAVVGAFTVTVDNPADDFTFVGSQGGSHLALMEFESTEDTVIDGGVGGVVLTIGGEWPGDDNVDLSAATLANITKVVLDQGADLDLTIAQATAIGAGNFELADGATSATLHLSGLDGEPFALADYADGISVSVVDIAALPEVTLHPTTDLTGIGSLLVHEGTVLNLTAAQYQQLNGAGAIIATDENGDGEIDVTVNITDLTQADVENGFDTSGITDGINLTITLAESVTFPADDGATVLTDLSGVDEINVGDDLTLSLPHVEDADGVAINGGVNSTLEFTDTTSGAFQSTDASGYNVTYLKMLNVLVDDRNIDLLFTGLPESVTKVIYNGQGWVEGVNQTVVIEEGTTVPGFVVFNKPESDVEIQNFILNLNGGTEIDGNLRLSSSVKTDANGNDLIQTHLQSVTINSTGTAANLLTGETANIIDGDITSQGTGNQGSYLSVDNNLLDLTINADQELIVEGDVIFESVTGDDSITANDNDEAIAALTVNGSADVYIDGINTQDNDVDGLNVVNNGTGVLTIQIDGDNIDQTINGDANEDALSFTGTGDIHLIIDPTVDLSNDDLSAVTQITIEDDGTLYLTQAQVDAIGIGNLLDDGEDTLDGATLHIVEFGSDPFDATALDPGINLASITITDADVTLNAATNLTDVGAIRVQEGRTLTLTAAQFQQLAGDGTISGVDTDGDSTIEAFNIVITGLTQADVDAGFDLSDVNVSGGTITIHLGEPSVDLGTFEDGVLVPGTEAVLNGAQFVLADNETLGLVNYDQANGLDVDGGANSTLIYKFTDLETDAIGPDLKQIDASGYDVTHLRALAASFTIGGAANVEFSIDDLPSSVILTLYEDPADLGFLDPTFRQVVIEAGITTPTGLIFNDWDDTDEVRTLNLTLEGDVTLNGNLSIPTRTDKDGDYGVQQFFQRLTINSEGAEPNTINGNVNTATVLGAPNTSENSLLDVVINAEQDLVIDGDIAFNSVDTDGDADTATLTLTGTANVTIDHLDISNTVNDDIGGLVLANNLVGGTLTVLGGTPAIVDGGSGSFETLTITGTGNTVLGVDDDQLDEDGIDSATVSVIDASGSSGDLTIGTMVNIDSQNFTFTSGTGVTQVWLDDDQLDEDLPADTGWAFDFTNAAVGSELHIGSNVDYWEGQLTFNMGANGTLYIDNTSGAPVTVDLTDDEVFLAYTGANAIVLADGVTLILRADQANGLDIVAGPNTNDDGDADDYTGVVNIVGLDNDQVYDFSGIIPAGTITLAEDDVTVEAATNLGTFSITLTELADTSASLAGQTIRFSTEAQATRDIIVDEVIGDNNDSSTNVVWLFTSIAAAGGIDTSGYDGALGRLWLNEDLIANEGGDIENLFTTLPSTILRVDFGDITELNVLLNSNAVDRIIEFTNFVTVGDLTFNDMGISPVEHIRNLDMRLGGEATVGDVIIDDIIGAPGYDPDSVEFQTLTINSYRAMHQDDLLASEDYVNDNDGTPEVGEHEQPDNINTIGDIGVGAANNVDLLSVVIDTHDAEVPNDGQNDSRGAAIEIGTITYDAADAGSIADLDVTGENDVTIASVNTADADIVGITTSNTLAGGATLIAPGASPAFNLDNTEGWVLTGSGDMALGSATNAGVVGNDLSLIDASATTGDLDFGVVAQIDSTDDLAEDNNGDGDTTDSALYEDANIAFAFVAGQGVTTMTLGTANGRTPQLNAGQTWSFDYNLAAAGSSLTITEDVIFQPTVDPLDPTTLVMVGVPVVIDGEVDLTQITLDFDSATTVFVPEGNTLILTIQQALDLTAAGVHFFGEGTTEIVGDGTDLDLDTSAFRNNMDTVNIDISGVTLDVDGVPPADDADGFFVLNVGSAVDDEGNSVGHNLTGSAFDDVLDGGIEDDTITGGAGDDVLIGFSGADTFIVDAGTDTVVGLAGDGDPDPLSADDDVLIVDAGATANAGDITQFVATSDTINNGTANLTTAVGGGTIDVSAAGGANGFNLFGDLGADELIGGNLADVLEAGGDAQGAGVFDTLTGNGGADTFRFTTDTSTPQTLGITTVVPGEDWERIDITAGAAGAGTITIPYSINNGATTANITVNLTGTETSVDVANAVRSAFATAGFNAVLADPDSVEVRGDFGSTLQLGTFNGGVTGVTGVTGDATTNTDVVQQTQVTVGTWGANAVVVGEVYSLSFVLAGGNTTFEVNYTATTTSEDAVALGLATLINGLGLGAVAALPALNTLTIFDTVDNNGGFTVTGSATGGFDGSSASGDKADVTTYDLITDFKVSGADKVDFQGLVAGSAANYDEGAEVANFATALADAELAMNGTIRYYLTSVNAGSGDGAAGLGVLFFDADADGIVDGGVRLVGVTEDNFVFSDITASPVV